MWNIPELFNTIYTTRDLVKSELWRLVTHTKVDKTHRFSFPATVSTSYLPLYLPITKHVVWDAKILLQYHPFYRSPAEFINHNGS
jgi:hypothetical protein